MYFGIEVDFRDVLPLNRRTKPTSSEAPDRGIKVKAGKTYWIMVKAHAHVDAGWNVNSMGLSGQYAV